MDLNNKKILVTGGAGFIGSNLVMEIQEKYPRAEITVIDNFSSGHYDNLKGFNGDLIAENIAAINLDKYFAHLDIIFHQAAITDTIFSDYQKIIFENIEGFRNVLKFAISHRADFIYASSSAVYGNIKPPMKVGYGESPLGPYGFSKLITDNIAKKYFDTAKNKIVGLRYFIVYGPREYHKVTETRGSLIWKIYSEMKKGKRPILFGDGQQKRDFVYTKDVIKANLLALGARKNGIFNVGTGKATTFNELVNILNKCLGTNLQPEYMENPYKTTYQYYSEADLSETKEFLGYTPEYDLEGGIKDYLK